MSYLKKLLIALDQLVNALLGGWPDESLSSRAYRRYMDGNEWLCRTIDCLFFWEDNHCKSSYESERNDRHLPPEMRNSNG